MKKRWRLLFAVSILLILGGAETAAQGPAVAGYIVLWSSQGPVTVERAARISPTDLGATDAERLLQELIRGPTIQEQQAGLWTTIPQGTALLDVLVQSGQRWVVRLDVPQRVLQRLEHEPFEMMVSQIGGTLIGFEWHDLRIQVKDPLTGTFVALADFLPPVTVPFKPSTPLEKDIAVSRKPVGQPPAPGQAQPSGALSGKTVYVSAGHGWEWVYSYRAGTERWETQRPPYPNSPSYDGPIIEDHNNAEAVNQYLLRYLWNAGAMVWTARERDMNPNQVLVDDGPGDGFVESGWTLVSDGYGGQRHETETVTGAPSATASWSRPVPVDGRYAVYVWYRSGSDADRTSDARYTVHHAGGQTTVSVDQRVHGHTWHYIGTYGFLAAEEARVTLTNQASVDGRTVVADAVRFGGGTCDDLSGIVTAADWPPYEPWWEVAAFYYTQRMGMDAAYGDITARPIYARWEHTGTGDDAVYVSWHTNGATGYQSSFSGTETYAHNSEGLPRTDGSLELRNLIHDEVVHDIRAGWDASWIDRGKKLRNLGELRLLWDESNPSARMPGALIEIGFHDHPDDTDALKEPAFNMLVARAIYQGIAKHFDPAAILIPEPPTHLAVVNTGVGSLRVSWQPPATDGEDLAGDAATGYRVYTSTNGIGWSNGVPVSSGTDALLTGLPANQLLFVRVTATNGGGESFPTETLTARVGDAAEVLLVNGFDRLNRTMVLYENDPVEGLNARMLLDRMNRFDYVVQHGEAIDGFAFDSASNEAVQLGSVDLKDYTIVDWILGEESVDDETLNVVERSMLRGFLSGGGALFISGSEIGYDLDLDGTGADPAFYNGVLRADYVGDDADTHHVYGVSGPFSGLAFSFDAPGMYDADYPDQLETDGGSEEALRYQGGKGGTAAVQYANGCERVITFGFPFETIQPHQQDAVMSAVMDFLDECMDPRVDTVIDSPMYGSAHASPPAFTGTAYADEAAVSGIEVLVQHISSGQYWGEGDWVAEETWLTAAGSETWFYALPPSLTDGDYHLRARARTGDIQDASPAEVIFTYDRTPPAQTTLIAPTKGITIAALPHLMLDWTDVDSAGGSDISYRVELDDQVWTTSSSWYTKTQVEEGSHGWRVEVRDAAGNASGWTPWETFSISRLHAWLPLVLRRSGDGPPLCSDVVLNGGFELDQGWIPNPEDYSPYSTAKARDGLRSGIVGYDDLAYSSVRQTMVLPAGSHATLRLWLYPISQNSDPGDWQYLYLWDQAGQRHNLEVTTSDAREWRSGEYDVSDFMGQQVTVIVGAFNDGDGNLTRVYVDDVELEVCP